MSGGALYVTNTTHTATLDVRQGSFLLSGGNLVVDTLVVTNNSCGGSFDWTGGRLAYRQLLQASSGVRALTNLVLDGGASAGVGTGAATFGGPSTLYVTNQSHTAVLNLVNGTFVLGSGGLLVVDNLVVTNANGRFFRSAASSGDIVLAPYLDADGDGQSNTNEVLAGTDPLDPNSVFETLSGTVVNRSDVQVNWTTEGGHSYVVQWAPNLGRPASFVDLSPVITVAGTGPGTTNYVHVGAATNGAGFYRVRLGP